MSHVNPKRFHLFVVSLYLSVHATRLNSRSFHDTERSEKLRHKGEFIIRILSGARALLWGWQHGKDTIWKSRVSFSSSFTVAWKRQVKYFGWVWTRDIQHVKELISININLPKTKLSKPRGQIFYISSCIPISLWLTQVPLTPKCNLRSGVPKKRTPARR